MGGRVEHLFQRQVRHAAGKVFRAERAVFAGLRPQPARFLVQPVQPGAEHPLLQQRGQLLPAAELGGPIRLPDRGGFLQNQKGIFKIIQQRGGLRITDGQILVHGFGQDAPVQRGQVGGHCLFHGGAFFAPLFCQRGTQRGGGLRRRTEQHLAGGADVDFRHRFLPALGG